MANNPKKPIKKSNKSVSPKLVTNKEETKAIIKLDQNVSKGFGDFLLNIDKRVAQSMAEGHTDAELKELFKVDDEYLADMRLNPAFVKLYNQQVLSSGAANKSERVAKAKRAFGLISDKFFDKAINEQELDKQNITTLFRMMNEQGDRLERLLGEGVVSEQNINILIKNVIKDNTHKNIEDFDNYDPKVDFNVIDVSSEEVK